MRATVLKVPPPPSGPAASRLCLAHFSPESCSQSGIMSPPDTPAPLTAAALGSQSPAAEGGRLLEKEVQSSGKQTWGAHKESLVPPRLPLCANAPLPPLPAPPTRLLLEGRVLPPAWLCPGLRLPPGAHACAVGASFCALPISWGSAKGPSRCRSVSVMEGCGLRGQRTDALVLLLTAAPHTRQVLSPAQRC